MKAAALLALACLVSGASSGAGSRAGSGGGSRSGSESGSRSVIRSNSQSASGSNSQSASGSGGPAGNGAVKRAGRGAGSGELSVDWGSNAARWLDIIQQYAAAAVQHQRNGGGGVPAPFTVRLPGGAADALPLLVLPVPVPDPTLGCSAQSGASSAYGATLPQPFHRPEPPPYHPEPFRPQPEPFGPQPEPYTQELYMPEPPHPKPYPQQPHYPAPQPTEPYEEPYHRPPPTQEPEPAVLHGDKCGGGYTGKGPVPTARLVQLFQAQEAPEPQLPPALLGPPPPPLPPPRGPQPSAQYLPPLPLRWDRSLHLRARLTVPRAGYTEPYAVWWDAATGASRVELHDANTTCVRQSDGRLLQRLIDRSGEPIVRRCGVAAATAPAPPAPPGLPDPEPFSFAGHAVWEGRPAERWTHTAAPPAGEGGAAPGEALVLRHELLVSREGALALPLRYSVDVESSALGPHAGGYVHHYSHAAPIDADPALFLADPAALCDAREPLDAADPEHYARLAPLHEYALPIRDLRHNAAWCRFKHEYRRAFADEREDAMRKNLFVHTRRFVGSCNREGATFEAEVNFLGDRLDAELDVLNGVRYEDERGAPESDRFPEDEAEADGLPDEFDWRDLGGVTPVLYQGSCSSCWAFAVAGSVEGALFAATRRVLPLAEQALVDCGHSHGAHGCNGTWPVHAYAYVRERGLPARGEYPEYSERVMSCRAPPVPPVTRISGHVDTPPRSVRALQLAIRRHAPNVVVIDSRPKSYLFYKRGVLRDERCLKGPKRKLNHAVLAVGWGRQRGEPHFIMKNTYSARWGDAGFVRMHASSNTCGVLTVPSYARLTRRDVVREMGSEAPIDGTRTDA